MTYLDAVAKIEDLEPAAVLYFSLVEEKIDKRKSPEEIEKDIKENFKMDGLIAADVKLIKMMDKSLETGASSIVHAHITTNRSNMGSKVKYN